MIFSLAVSILAEFFSISLKIELIYDYNISLLLLSSSVIFYAWSACNLKLLVNSLIKSLSFLISSNLAFKLSYSFFINSSNFTDSSCFILIFIFAVKTLLFLIIKSFKLSFFSYNISFFCFLSIIINSLSSFIFGFYNLFIKPYFSAFSLSK